MAHNAVFLGQDIIKLNTVSEGQNKEMCINAMKPQVAVSWIYGEDRGKEGSSSMEEKVRISGLSPDLLS